MNSLSIWVVRNVKRILFAAALVIIVEVGACWCGYGLSGESHPLGKAIESTGGFLMTLNSPESLHVTSTSLFVAHCLGWAVSLIGWLLIPLLIGVSLARSQSVDLEYQELCYRLLRRAEKCGLPKNEAATYVADIMTKLENHKRKDR